MFKSLEMMRQLSGLLGNLPKLKEQMDQFQAKLAQIFAEGDAGAGMVKVKVNGKMEMVSCTIAPEATGDRELLEDLVRAATNQALERIKLSVAQETQKMSAEMGFPMPGMGLPGME